MNDPLMRERYGLEHHVYSPILLAQALRGVFKKGAIYKAIKEGRLRAQRTGGKNIIIFRPDIEAWLTNLPPATAPTNWGGSRGKRAPSIRKDMSPSERGIASMEARRRKHSLRGEKQK